MSSLFEMLLLLGCLDNPHLQPPHLPPYQDANRGAFRRGAHVQHTEGLRDKNTIRITVQPRYELIVAPALCFAPANTCAGCQSACFPKDVNNPEGSRSFRRKVADQVTPPPPRPPPPLQTIRTPPSPFVCIDANPLTAVHYLYARRWKCNRCPGSN